MVGEGGELSWPWLRSPLQEVLNSYRGQALLVHGASGLGSLEFSLALAQGWLCESASDANGEFHRPCGRCESCRLVQAHTHPDLHVRLPEEMALALEWRHRYDDKRKPSRQIRIDDIREALDWIVTTPGRGVAKVLVVHPGDTMNAVAASALLKTLEEPPAQAKIILTAADPARLLPTILSRCQRWVLPKPSQTAAKGWLAERGVTDAELLLAATSGFPLDALRMSQEGLTGQVWNQIPRALERGDATAFDRWPIPRVLDALFKVCHDACVHTMAPKDGGGSHLFFPSWAGGGTSLQNLETWRRSLQRISQHADHPWNEALLIDSLVAEGHAALSPPSRRLG